MLARHVLVAGLCLALTAIPDAFAQEIVLQGIRVRLTDQDNAWIARSCERRSLVRDTAPFRKCVADSQRDILEQRGRDAVTRPSPNGGG